MGYLLNIHFYLTFLKNIFSWNSLKLLFAVYGVIWTLVESTSYFWEDIKIIVQPNWYWLLTFSVIITLITSIPKIRFSYKVANKDLQIEIRIGNIFSHIGDYLVVGTNTIFATELNNEIISPKSIQGKFTKKYFKRNWQELQENIDRILEDEEKIELPDPILSRKVEYPFGTVVNIPITHFWKNRNALFVAISKMNQHAIAHSSLEDFQISMLKLWEYIGSQCNLGEITMPILGSGFSRIDVPRVDLFKEIVKSFLVATTNKKFCEKLTIVIYFRDVAHHSIDLEYVKDFLDFQCKYFENKPKNLEKLGTGLGT
jgi:Thoeris protein ThsA, Macro domain